MVAGPLLDPCRSEALRSGLLRELKVLRGREWTSTGTELGCQSARAMQDAEARQLAATEPMLCFACTHGWRTIPTPAVKKSKVPICAKQEKQAQQGMRKLQIFLVVSFAAPWN
ncbi:unnamed protein product [Durusdinium trenchii]|uniref:Uncharacterized protein n=1 Tax=Durusdinium trenchii TaxID=1381693 RepID=A0ABP0MU10_9DINO